MAIANDFGGTGDGAQARDDQAALGTLINIAGRQRMLSHRVVMFLALSQIAGAGDGGQMLDAAGDALQAYQNGVRVLLQGDPGQSGPLCTSQRVAKVLGSPAGSGRSGARELEGFGARVEACLDGLRTEDRSCAGEIRALANIAGDVLLPLLNEIVAALEAELADAVQAEAERAANIQLVMSGALDDIEQTASRIRLIAFNALIEAARAGHAGRAFSVIAEEIRRLGAQTGEESAKMQAAMRRLFAA